MPFINDPFNVLVEAANNDIMTDTKTAIRESEIISRYSALEEVSDPLVITAEMVTVVNLNGELFTEMQFLAPYMKCNKIKSVAEAMNNVCEANGLAENSIGLLVENQECVTDMIEKALDKGPKAKKKVLDKIDKAEGLIDKIKSKGIKVKQKSKKCPKCGQEKCVCEDDVPMKVGKQDDVSDGFEECDSKKLNEEYIEEGVFKFDSEDEAKKALKKVLDDDKGYGDFAIGLIKAGAAGAAAGVAPTTSVVGIPAALTYSYLIGLTHSPGTIIQRQRRIKEVQNKVKRSITKYEKDDPKKYKELISQLKRVNSDCDKELEKLTKMAKKKTIYGQVK